MSILQKVVIVLVDIKNLELMYFQNDEPVIYELKNPHSKGYRLKISPILVKDWAIFENSMDLLTHDQQDYKNPTIVLMTYLEFILNILIPNDGVHITKLSNIMRMSLGFHNVKMGKYKNKDCLVIMENDEQKNIITPKEFDEIKKIILFQNNPNYDDRYISPDVKKEIAEYEAIKYKDIVNPTLEKQKVFVISKTGMTMNILNNMTYRTFIQVYQSNVNSDLYFAQKMIQASEKYVVKEDVVHPLFKKEEGKFEDAFVSKSGFKGKIKGAI